MVRTIVILAALTSSFAAYSAEKIQGVANAQVPVAQVKGHGLIPSTGALAGSVVTEYTGAGAGMTTLHITVENTEASCMEAEDCSVHRTFSVKGFQGKPTGIYSRKVDAQTYSIAVIGNKVLKDTDREGRPLVKPTKVLLRVRFTDDAILEDAEISLVKP